MAGYMARPAVAGGELQATNVPEVGVPPGADSSLRASAAWRLPPHMFI